MEKLAKERAITIIFVTHGILFSRKVADRVIFMEDGVIVEQGHPEQVLKKPAEERTRQFLNKVTQPLA
jgi:ABC-type polar amino acid transport system ATPase subunit